MPSPTRTLGSWVRISLKAWMYVCVYSVFVLGSELATRWSPSKESYQLSYIKNWSETRSVTDAPCSRWSNWNRERRRIRRKRSLGKGESRHIPGASHAYQVASHAYQVASHAYQVASHDSLPCKPSYNWRLPSSGMWRRVDLVDWTDVSEERIASIFRVEKSASEEPAWAGGCRLLDLHSATSQKTAFFIVTAVKTSQILHHITGHPVFVLASIDWVMCPAIDNPASCEIPLSSR
jgi:hypothetical protein